MRIDISEVRQRFGGYILSRARMGLQGRDEADILTVVDSVYKDLERIGEIRGEHGDDSLRNLIKRVTWFNCVDYIRRWNSKKNLQPRNLQLANEGGVASTDASDYGADPAAVYEAGQELAEQADIASLADLAVKHGIKSKNLALLEDRIAGLSRREVAKKHDLSENQVHCRLVYLKRKILAGIEKRKRLDRLGTPGR